jgi:uncharacterized protein DUF2064
VTTRFVAVLAGPDAPPQAPPGIEPEEFRLAMLEDVYEVAAGLDLVTPALAAVPADLAIPVESIIWPGTPVLREPDLATVFAALTELGGDVAALLVPDAPDLPPLLIGKLFRALSHAPVSVCPAADGGLVALAARLPVPGWLIEALPTLGSALELPDALTALRSAAPRPGLVQKAPGWHRLRDLADLGRLDPGLEGWENTRALLAGRPLTGR